MSMPVPASWPPPDQPIDRAPGPGFAIGMLAAAWAALTCVAPLILYITFGGDCAGPDLCPGPPKIIGDAYLVDFWFWVAAGAGVATSVAWPRRWLFAALAAVAAGLIGQSVGLTVGPTPAVFALLVLPGALTALIGALAGVRVMSDPQSLWAGHLAPGVIAGVCLYVVFIVGVVSAMSEDPSWFPMIAICIGIAAAIAVRTRSRRRTRLAGRGDGP